MGIFIWIRVVLFRKIKRNILFLGQVPQAAEMRGSPLFLCLLSTSCWVSLMPTAADKIFHFGTCGVSMSLAEIRAAFTAIKANIVSISQALREPLAAPGAPLEQQLHPISVLSAASQRPHPDPEHPVPPSLPAQG